METLSDILIQARDSLTPKNWRKGAYFKDDNGTLCMCAHGAVQAIANPQCRLKLAESLVMAPATALAAATAASVGAGEAANSPSSTTTAQQKNDWNNRPDWVKRERIINNKNYGNLDTSYLLGMVGLTITFNDDPDTTYEMVIEKFNKAIELAKKFETP